MPWVCEMQVWRSVIADFNWLLVKDIIDFAMMKLAFAGLYKKNIPENLQLKAT